MSIATALLLALCVVWPASLSNATDAPSPSPETQEVRP
jgi:hypothetical protein